MQGPLKASILAEFYLTFFCLGLDHKPSELIDLLGLVHTSKGHVKVNFLDPSAQLNIGNKQY
jgi:hypothetical protein